MLDANNFNTTDSIADLIDSVNQQNNFNNESRLLFSPTAASFAATADTTNSSLLMTDFVVNATAAVVDYTAQWLATTIATAASNLTASISNETFSPASSPLAPTHSRGGYANQSSVVSNFLNFTIPPTADITNSIINYDTNQTTNRTSSSSSLSSLPSVLSTVATITTTTAATITSPSPTSSSAATFILNTDLNGENPTFAFDGSLNYDAWSDCHPNNPNFNCSRMEYIYSILGPQTLPLFTSLIVSSNHTFLKSLYTFLVDFFFIII